MENIAKYAVAIIPFAGVILIFYSFAGIFSQKKLYKWLITALLILICLFVYYEINKPSKVVQMKEDVLYVKPKPKVLH
jgi:phosphoglycerol transferase MdoB-like AlkP superfamily enzyme